MVAAAARIETPHAPKYLAQLCRRFARSAPARLYDDEGFIDLPLGPCHLSALPGSLALVVEASDEEGLQHLQWVLANHLKRVARPKEALEVRWAPVW
jgi:hypothetical protein